MTSDQIGIFSNVSIIGEWKQEIDLFSNLSEIISNIVVTLSAFRSIAQPWRLFFYVRAINDPFLLNVMKEEIHR